MAPQLDRLRELLMAPPPPPGGRIVILASATMPAGVDERASAWLRNDAAQVVVKAGATDDVDADTIALPPPPPITITQAVHVCAAHKKTGKLLKHLSSISAASTNSRQRPRVAVFVNRIATAGAVAKELSAAGHKVALLHGGRPQAARDAALASFRAGATTILVATDVAARGLHIPTLRHVVNYDFPPNLETYVHRIGRAGRLEDGGHAFSFFTRPLAPLARPLLRLLDEAGDAVDPNLVRLADAYDEARARVAALPAIPAEEGVDAAKAARRAAVEEVLKKEKKGGGEKKRKKTKEKAEVADALDEEDESDEDDGPAVRAPKRLAKADLPGLYKGKRKVVVVAGSESEQEEEEGGGEEKAAPAPPSSKRRKALPGRLRKKQAAMKAAQKGGGGRK